MIVKRFFLTICAFCFLSSNLMSQVDSSSRIHPLGIGLHVEQYIISDVNGINDSPLNKIILCISPNNKYRFEPEFGLSFSENKTNKTSTNSVHFGLRAFRMIQRNKLNLYGGLRLGYQNVKKLVKLQTVKNIH